MCIFACGFYFTLINHITPSRLYLFSLFTRGLYVAFLSYASLHNQPHAIHLSIASSHLCSVCPKISLWSFSNKLLVIFLSRCLFIWNRWLHQQLLFSVLLHKLWCYQIQTFINNTVIIGMLFFCFLLLIWLWPNLNLKLTFTRVHWQFTLFGQHMLYLPLFTITSSCQEHSICFSVGVIIRVLHSCTIFSWQFT